MAPPLRIILHLDMDAFFAAVEQRERPELRGKPVIIGHRGRRGVVATCSYEARPFGVRSAMPSVTAERLCPDAIWVHGRMELYREVSRHVMAMLHDVAPIVEQVSVDEAYADLTGVAKSLDEGGRIAEELRARIREEERLTASAGIALCRFLAKIASDLRKPDGQVVLGQDAIESVLWPLATRVIPGVGPKLAGKLARFGMKTVGDIARRDERFLLTHFGAQTARFLRDRSHGIDERPIEPEQERKQISEERTYTEDLQTKEEIARELRARAEGVAHDLRRKGLLGKSVVLKVRDENFVTLTRTRALEEPTDLAQEIFDVGWRLFQERVDLGGRGVRLLGLGVKDLVAQKDVTPSLFPDAQRERARRAAQAADTLRAKFGDDAVKPARLVRKPEESP